ncbi:hypothetical protein K7432_002504 [Basidiobolus ranarum]|uniref:Uncharacterized protein n=1 Tax=Basidiobolus ranarum TaxID=34480 RepID=A0ABR2W7P5_9FUNG
MISGQKLLLVSAVLGMAVSATIDPRIKCTEDHNCGNDLDCIASCYHVPSPDKADIASTDACFAKCHSDDHAEMITCRQTCINEHFRPTGAIVTRTSTKSVEPSKTKTDKTSSTKSVSSSASASSSHSGSSSASSSSSSDAHTATHKSENSGSAQAPLLSIVSLAAAFAAVSALL